MSRVLESERPGAALLGFTGPERAGLLVLFGSVYIGAAALMWEASWAADAAVYAWLAMFAGVASLAFVSGRHSIGWLHPVAVTVFFMVFQVLRRLPAYVEGVSGHASPLVSDGGVPGLMQQQLMFESLALASYLVGFFAMKRTKGLRVAGGSTNCSVRAVAVGATLAGAAVTLGIVYLGGDGVWARLADFHTGGGRSEGLAGTYYVVAVASMGVPACLLWLSGREDAGRDWRFWACSAGALISSYLAGGSRAAIVMALLAGVIVVMLRRRRLLVKHALVAVVVGMGAVAGLGGIGDAMRGGGLVEARRTGPEVSEFLVIWDAAKEASRRATVGSGALAVYGAVPEEVGRLGGETYLAAAVSPVPSALWEQKPGLASGRVGREMFGADSGKPPGSVAEAYWNWGVVGIGIVHFLFGWFHRFLVSTVKRNYGVYWIMAAYAGTLVYFIQPTSNGAVGALTMIGSIYLLHLVTIRLSSRSALWGLRDASTAAAGQVQWGGLA